MRVLVRRKSQVRARRLFFLEVGYLPNVCVTLDTNQQEVMRNAEDTVNDLAENHFTRRNFGCRERVQIRDLFYAQSKYMKITSPEKLQDYSHGKPRRAPTHERRVSLPCP